MRILIATNHSYMFYRFRKELVEALMQEHESFSARPLWATRTICRPWDFAASAQRLTAAASILSRT